MPRAKSDGGLTGGTGDVNPQIFRLSASSTTVLNSGQTVGISSTQPVPINRLGQKGERVVVMELLKVRYHAEFGIPIAATGAKMAVTVAVVYLSTSPPNPGALGISAQLAFSQFPSDPKVIDFVEYHNGLLFSSFSENFNLSGDQSTQPIYHDLTDGAGHGILVATDNITLTMQAGILDLAAGIVSAQPSTMTSEQIACDVIYRFKEVSLKEYIGIVQSQQ